MNRDEEYQDDFGDNESPKAEYFDGTSDEDYAPSKEGQEPKREHEESAEPEEKNREPQEEQKKKKDNLRERFSEVRKENFQYLSDNERLRQENEKLRKDAEYYSQSAVKHYDDGVTQRLNYAKELYKAAEESGDVDAKVNAAQFLAELTAEKNRVNNFQVSQPQQQQQNQNQYQQYQQPQYEQPQQYGQQQPQQQMSAIDYIKNRELQRWDEDNTWFNKNSRDYDPWLAEKTTTMLTGFNDDLARRGQQGVIGTPDYMDVVDAEIRKIRGSRGNQNNNRGPNMSQSRMPTHSSRNMGSGGQQFARRQEEHTPITKEEASYARLSGIDPEVFRKYKAIDIKTNPHLRENIANRGR